MSVPIPEELRGYVKSISLDPKTGDVVVIVSLKLFFSFLIATSPDPNIKRWVVKSVRKDNEKIFVYIDPNVQLSDPFDSVESRITVNQAKLEKMVYSNPEVVERVSRLYYLNTNDDVELHIYVTPRGGTVGGSGVGKGQAEW